MRIGLTGTGGRMVSCSKALLVEPGDALGMVCHYIHLDPVRAQIVRADQLQTYRHGSYRLLFAPVERPRFLPVNAFLVQAGNLADTPAGSAAYRSYLSWQATEGPAGRNAAYARMSTGWASARPNSKKASCSSTSRIRITARGRSPPRGRSGSCVGGRRSRAL